MTELYVDGQTNKISGKKYCNNCDHEDHSENDYQECLHLGCNCKDSSETTTA